LYQPLEKATVHLKQTCTTKLATSFTEAKRAGDSEWVGSRECLWTVT